MDRGADIQCLGGLCWVVTSSLLFFILFSKRLGPSVNGFCNLWDQGTDTLVDQILEELDGLVICQIQLETLFNLGYPKKTPILKKKSDT